VPAPRPQRRDIEPIDRGEHRSLRSAILELIRQDLVSGMLPPGQPISVRDLYIRFGGGHSAIREALCQLAADGMVVAEDQRGFRARPISAKDLTDVTRARVEIEVIAIRDAIANGTMEWEAKIISEFHLLSRVPKRDVDDARRISPMYKRRHRAFHGALIASCASDWIKRFHSTLNEHSERYRELIVAYYASDAPTRDVMAEHRALMQAAIARDADRAARLVAEHIEKTATNLRNAGVAELS
jgi:DNA-binding GntR family transcriptional regulator